MKLISGRDPLPEESRNAYPPEEARELVRRSLGEPEPIRGVEELRQGLMLDTDSQVLSQVESGEWLLVKPEACYFDQSHIAMETKERRVAELVRSPPPQPQPPRQTLFRLVDSETWEPFSHRRFASWITGERSEIRTDAAGVIHSRLLDASEIASLRLGFELPGFIR